MKTAPLYITTVCACRPAYASPSLRVSAVIDKSHLPPWCVGLLRNGMEHDDRSAS